MTKFDPHVVVVSLGNRGKYYKTLHSAGHFALQSLRKAIIANSAAAGVEDPEQVQTEWDKSDREGFRKKYAASYGDKYTLLQTPMPMNVSGAFVRTHWLRILDERSLRPHEMGLVVVHDDLEEDFGAVRVRNWTSSHRGHNGVKHVNGHLTYKEFPGALWSRISVGIDRPASREDKDVADYVLSPLSDHQMEIIDTQVGSKVLACLQEIEMEWKQAYEKEAAEASAPPPKPKSEKAAKVKG
ncbi:hypothetical protein SLS62_007878 [Diatrype stigma]|uniref:Peptidyl-tRNA hydrolase n=1 Tax=Diatrype stigma TaxID=117547 RepID=A0AAN9UYN6_9PEZI